MQRLLLSALVFTVFLFAPSAVRAQCVESPLNDLFYWGTYSNSSQSTSIVDDPTAVCGTALRVALEQVENSPYTAGFQLNSGTAPADEAGKEYVIRFRYRADAPRTIYLRAFSRDLIAGANTATYSTRDLTVTTEWQQYTRRFVSRAPANTESAFSLLIMNGDATTPFYVDNFEIKEVGETCAESPLADATNHTTYGTAMSTAVEDLDAVCGTAARVALATVQPNYWDAGVDVAEAVSMPDSGGQFRVSFNYRALAERPLTVAVRSRLTGTFGSDDRTFFEEQLTAGPDYKRYDAIITSDNTDPDRFIYFLVMIGDDTTTLFLDDISVTDYIAPRSVPTTLYVSPTGSNENSGFASDDDGAFQTVKYGISNLIPGDTLVLADGTYRENGVQVYDLHGTAEQPTVIRSANQWGAKIQSTATYNTIFEVVESSHVIVEGIEVFNLNNVPFQDWNSGFNAFRSHHVTFRNNYAHDCGCGGLGGRESDYLIFERNVARDNAKTNPYNCSGISIYQPTQLDDAPGFHIIIRENVCFENECRLPFEPGGFDVPTDGNGIILDDYNWTQAEGEPFLALTLIENNLVFNNGGNGIKIYETDNAVVRNNTSYHNNFVLEEYGNNNGEIGFQQTAGAMEAWNNVTVKTPGQRGAAISYVSTNTGTFVAGNNVMIGRFIVGGESETIDNQLVEEELQSYVRFGESFDAQFEFSSVDDFRPFFALRPNSPGLDEGNDAQAPPTDLTGVARPQGSASDIGAFEGTVPGVGPLPGDVLLNRVVTGTAIRPTVDGRRDAAYLAEDRALAKSILTNPTDATDLSATWTNSWDTERLYVVVSVTDDNRVFTGGDYTATDAVELFLDGDASRGETYDGANDLHFYYQPTAATPLGEVALNRTDGVVAAYEPTEDGYVVEFSVPWSVVGLSPEVGVTFGIDVAVNDNDGNGVESRVAWQASAPGADSDPRFFGTATLAAGRPTGVVKGWPDSFSPTVDGEREEEWDIVPEYALGNVITGTVLNGLDLSGKYRSSWDENNLYFFVEVRDDQLTNDSQNSAEDDGVEIYLDLGTERSADYDANDHRIVIEWDGDPVYSPSGNLGEGTTAVVNTTGARSYNVEVAVPWSALGVTPLEDLVLGVDVQVIDDDNGGSADGKIAWWGTTDDAFRDPSVFGLAQLGPRNGLATFTPAVNPLPAYPNPTTGNLTLGLPAAADLDVAVVDVRGRLVARFAGTNQLDLSGLAPGSYVVSARSRAGIYRTVVVIAR